MESLRDNEWRRLIRMIQNDACILLLGPGVAFDPADRDSTPLSTKLAQLLADQLDAPPEVMGEDALAHIAQIYQRENDRISLELEVEDFYRNYKGQTTEVHRRLAALPVSLYIDLTPSDLMAHAFDEVGKTPVRGFYGSDRGQAISLVDFIPERPLVYELFGSLDDSASLILTENDLLDFLVNVAKNTPALPKDLTSRFSDPKTSFLFLGFGFQHWYLRVLLHTLKAGNDRKNFSIALEDAAFFEHPAQPQTALFYSEQHRIQFRYTSWQAFAEELSQRFHHDSSPDRPDQPSPSMPLREAPTAFLCHCSEDAEVVAAVSAKLQHLGVNTWVDRQNLRGGDHWDRLLGKAINDWVDYFIVLETPTMLSRTESYFYKEIDHALERARGFRQGTKFIFPVELVACERLEILSHLQRLDLTSPGGLEQLAQDIRDDWALRLSA